MAESLYLVRLSGYVSIVILSIPVVRVRGCQRDPGRAVRHPDLGGGGFDSTAHYGKAAVRDGISFACRW